MSSPIVVGIEPTLDHLEHLFRVQGGVALSEACRVLKEVREVTGDWREFCAQARTHPLHELVMQCPFNAHAHSRPRGYPGDAVLLDHIYFPDRFRDGLSDFGRDLHSYMGNSTPARAVRLRRALLAQYVDRAATAKKRGGANILSLACGHLREAELASSLTTDLIEKWWAVDQDPLSLAEVKRALGHHSVIRPEQAQLKDVLSGAHVLDTRFDLIYAAGLYDYLNQDVAKMATSFLWRHVAPGGTLLLANFLPNIPEQAWMECFMRWYLIYRDKAAMLDLSAGLPQAEIVQQRTFREPDDQIVFLEIVKKENQ